MIRKIVRQLSAFLRKWFWTKPTEKPREPKATQVIHNYICVKYKDQWINLKKTEVAAFHAMARSDKRAMAMRFRKMQEKGKIRFEEINGQMVCIKNKDYENR
jgi:hypothetical protein